MALISAHLRTNLIGGSRITCAPTEYARALVAACPQLVPAYAQYSRPRSTAYVLRPLQSIAYVQYKHSMADA
eukprot:1980594-Rhodomonas_salina.2